MNYGKLDKNKNWGDWRWQMRNAIHSSAEFARKFHRNADQFHTLSDVSSVERRFPALATPYYASLVSRTGTLSRDPIFKQAFPDIIEVNDSDAGSMDPLGEEKDSPVPRLIHRYTDRVVLLTTNACAIHCRFCLRKRGWADGSANFAITEDELDAVISYLMDHTEVREVLISGGDPLLLETARIADILSRISQVPSIKIIRIGTRAPVTLPMRIDDELVDVLASIPGLWVATHFNHPVELTDESLEACSKLVSNGIPILNQTVLLKGINDSARTLIELFANLGAHRIKPHYLFHLDPVVGTAHFATGVEKGLAIMKKLRGELSSVATPTFAIDLPDGGGKVPLQPDYKRDGKYESINGEFIPYY